MFYTNAVLSAGVQIGPGGNQWLSFSDVNMKRDFRALDGETVLAKLAGMPVQEWGYIAQDAPDAAASLALARECGIALPGTAMASQIMARVYGLDDEKRR